MLASIICLLEFTFVDRMDVHTKEDKCISRDQTSSSSEASQSLQMDDYHCELPADLEENSYPARRIYTQARLRATFYPKFENEKSDLEIRKRMIEVVQAEKGVLEVTLKHSGSLFMYSGDHVGAFAKNSFGNLYTAVGVFTLATTFQEAWRDQAAQKQREFNKYLERNHLCVSMELVTSVLGDHGQRPRQDYVVVTAVTDLTGKPEFFATPDLIAFCRQWRLPTNQVWLFSSRKSATSFFTSYDALCEEGTTTTVSRTLDEISDISVQASKSHTEAQGEILEGLVARIVSPKSTERLQKVIEDFPLVVCKGSRKLTPQSGLREICTQHMNNETEKIKALLYNAGPDMCSNWSDWSSEATSISFVPKFIKATALDHITLKLQEIFRVIWSQRMRIRTPCHLREYDSEERKALYRVTLHVLDDYAFRKYQKEMWRNPGLWPLYRGFFMDVYLLYGDKRAESVDLLSNRVYTGLQINADHTTQLADESENLMLKLKFLPYKIRTFLIRNGLSILYRSGFQAYRKYYLRQLENWNTSSHKQQQLDQLLTEWAKFVTTKYKGKGINSNAYLSEAEPFLAQFAKRSFQNRRLVGYTGSNPEEELLNNDSKDEDTHVQQYLASEQEDNDLNGKGMVIFFPGIPGSGKSALCAKLVADPGELGAARSIHFLMGDLVKGKYWPMLAKERQRRPVSTITVADKNAPNLEVWETIEDICERTSAIGVPVVPDSPGTEDNPFSLDILALFMFRVIQRVNHPGNLDKDSPNAGYILLMFYKLYSGKDRKEFEQTLRQRFGYLVKLSTLKSNRPSLPSVIEHVLSEGLELFDLHSMKHKSSKRTSAKWSAWEKHLREVLNENASYFNDIQTPLEETFQSLRQQLVAIAKGAIPMVKSTREERSFKSIAYAFIALPVEDIINIIQQLAETSPEIQMYFLDKNFTMSSAHITLAHKRSHGVAAVAAYGEICGVEVPVRLTSFLFSDKTCALEAQIIENQQGIVSRNQWPHVTIWTAEGTKPKESNSLPEVVRSGHASRVDFMPIELSGVVELS